MDKILNTVIDRIYEKFKYRVKKGALPKGNSLSMYIGAGSPTSTYFNKSNYNKMYVTLNGKNKSQEELIQTLEQIHQYLTTLTLYPQGDDWQITNISTSSAVNFVGQEEGGAYLYGSILQIDYYLGGNKLYG